MAERTSEPKTTLCGDVAILTVSGELDLALCIKVAPELNAAVRSTARAVVIDLENVSMVDSSGIALLLSAFRRLDHAGRQLASLALWDHRAARLSLQRSTDSSRCTRLAGTRYLPSAPADTVPSQPWSEQQCRCCARLPVVDCGPTRLIVPGLEGESGGGRGRWVVGGSERC